MTEIYDDIDAWLDGAKRAERTVEVYGRADLLADIELLESEQRTLNSIPDEDRAFAGDDGDDLQAKIDALNEQIAASKIVLRVRALIDDEVEVIRAATAKEIKTQLDEAAAEARTDARVQCERAGIKGANDINQLVRTAAITASTTLLQKEADLRVIAEAVVSPRMDIGRVKKLVDLVGEAQTNKIKEAYSRATTEAPRVMIPKSRKPSPSDDGAMSS